MAKPRQFDPITLAEARKRWERDLHRKAVTNDGKPAPNTIRTYLRDVDEMIALTKGADRPADDIEAEDIEDALLAIASLPDRRYKHSVKRATPGRGVASRVRWTSSVRAFFTWAAEKGYVQVSPMESIAVAAPPRGHAREGLTLEETTTLIEHIATHPSRTPKRDYALVSFMAESGPRVSEVCRLTVDDLVRLDSGTWAARIRRSKGRKDRDLPVSDALATLMREYVGGERARAVLRLPAGRTDPSTLFLTHNGSSITPRDVQRMLDKACAAAGLRHCTPHGLRHTALTQMGITGVAPQTIRDIAGHSSLDTTSLYLDASNEENAAAVQHSPLAARIPGDS